MVEKELAKLIQSGVRDLSDYGHINIQDYGDLVLLSYSKLAMFANIWNEYECACRGLIVDATTGEIVALPFDKFFNYGQTIGDNEIPQVTSAKPLEVWEKMDGSLGISYIHDGAVKVATRGSLTSDQAMWATKEVQQYSDFILEMSDWTFMFEIIYAENRIVVDYDGFEGLVLLGMRNRHTGQYKTADELFEIKQEQGFILPSVYNVGTVEDILEILPTLDANNEGFVVVFDDGTRFKFKGSAYIKAHRIMSNLSLKNVFKALQDDAYVEYVSDLPDEFRVDVDAMRDSLLEKYQEIETLSQQFFNDNYDENRRVFAERVLKTRFASLMFLMYDNREMAKAIWKQVEQELSL